MLFGYEFSLVALIGTILLIGIVKKNGIMMVDFAISAERDDGLTPVEAIRQAALLRFRPIMMTTIGGAARRRAFDAEPRHRPRSCAQPLGYTMVGGLIVSQALTLFTTPVIYLYLDRLSQWLSGSKKKAKAPKAQREPEQERDERPWEPAQAAE